MILCLSQHLFKLRVRLSLQSSILFNFSSTLRDGLLAYNKENRVSGRKCKSAGVVLAALSAMTGGEERESGSVTTAVFVGGAVVVAVVVGVGVGNGAGVESWRWLGGS